MKIAGIQTSCTDDIDRNIQKALRFIGHAVDSGAQILCFPQLFHLPWFPAEQDPKALDLAIEIGDQILEPFREAAKKHQVVLVCPFFEKDEGKTYNSAAIIDTQGALTGVCRKAHIPDLEGWKEKYYFEPGEGELGVFETAFGRIGVQLCWDNFFPEVSRSLALQGAQIIFAPTAAAYASQERWLHVISANAFVNNLFVFRVNRVGHDHGLDFYGRSFCVDPYGELIAGPVDMKESIVLADVNLSMVDEAREQSGFFRDRRTQLYKTILNQEAPKVE